MTDSDIPLFNKNDKSASGGITYISRQANQGVVAGSKGLCWQALPPSSASPALNAPPISSQTQPDSTGVQSRRTMFDPLRMRFQQSSQGMVPVEPAARIRCDVDLATSRGERAVCERRTGRSALRSVTARSKVQVMHR
jgi:hypothetical protein